MHEPLLPPGIRQLEDRLVGQDRLVDADRQLRPEDGAVVDGVVDSQEGGPAPVEVPELGVEGALPQLPSWAAGAWLVPRYGARVMMVGLLALLIGTVAAAVVYGTGRPNSYPWPLLPAVVVAGLGQGLYAVPFFTTALHHVRPHEAGSAAGLLNAVQQLGGTLGIALLGNVFFHITTRSDAHAKESAALAGARNAFCVAAVLILATAVATTFMHPRQQRSSPPTGPTPGHEPAAQHSSHG
ncbi:MFS transporter [Streptomyces sp. Root369]|uniref:MFS transporter n=1 Tax=Streptomyces sp. Root369 TaxID=1736523 RepID=UPI00070E0C6C|nr:MFS transporter [Streptomyces sp. Root369]KQW02687.1 hypothetical protein ASD08_44925 [Streptomyces sp. Root369]